MKLSDGLTDEGREEIVREDLGILLQCALDSQKESHKDDVAWGAEMEPHVRAVLSVYPVSKSGT